MSRETRNVAVAAVLVGVAALWLHWPSVHHSFLHWDDPVHVEEAQQQQRLSWATVRWAFTTIRPFSYFPLTRLLNVLNFQLWGTNPTGYHASSVVLHGVTSGLVTVFVWLLLRSIPAMPAARRLVMAAGVGLVFAIHPLQVEPVDWFAEQMTVLSGLFSIACLCAYVMAVGDTGGSRRWWWVMTGLFVAALLSKPVAVSLPLVMLAMDYYPLARHRSVRWPRLLQEKVWLALLSGAMIAEVLLVGSQGHGLVGLESVGLWERLLIAARGTVFYLWKLVWPAWLSPYYPLAGSMTLRRLEFLTPVVAMLVITCVSVWSWKRLPALLATWFAYLALILPVSGLVQVGGAAAADRYMYVAIVPPSLLLAAGCVWIGNEMRATARAALAVLVGCELVFFAVRTHEQIQVWADDEKLWRAVLTHYPDCALANVHLVNALGRQQRWQEAYDQALQAVATSPEYGDAHYALAALYHRARDYERAAAEFQTALRLDPGLNFARYGLSRTYAKMGRLDDAFETLRKLLSDQPQFANLAERDLELAGLRDQVDYAERFRALIVAASAQTEPAK